jgi:hypothetical protein
MVYRELNGRRQAVRCDACGTRDGVRECLFFYAAAGAARYDETRSSGPGSGQYYDLCQECREKAQALRQRFTDERGVCGHLRECCRSGTGTPNLAVWGSGLIDECPPHPKPAARESLCP